MLELKTLRKLKAARFLSDPKTGRIPVLGIFPTMPRHHFRFERP